MKNKSLKKRFIAALLLFAMMFTMAGVSADTVWAAKKSVMKDLNILWNLKPGKELTFKTAYGFETYHQSTDSFTTTEKLLSGKLTVKDWKITDAKNKNKNKLTFTVEFQRPSLSGLSKSEIDALADYGDVWGYETCGDCYVGAVDYITGDCLETENDYNVTVKTKWSSSNKKTYYGTSSAYFWQKETSKVKYTITYPKTYKNLCIVAGGRSSAKTYFTLKNGSSYSSDDFWNGRVTFDKAKIFWSAKDKKVCHGIRVK